MPIDMDNCILHNLQDDFSESVYVRDQHPEKLHELIEAFDQAAWLNLVYPLDNRSMLQWHFKAAAPQPIAVQTPGSPTNWASASKSASRQHPAARPGF